MSLLGKLLIVAVLVMSILFMTWGLTVFGTHTNLKTEAAALDQQVRAEQEKYEALKQRFNRLSAQLQGERRMGLFQLQKLEQEYISLRQRNADSMQQRQQMVEQRSDLASRVARSQQNNIRLGDQVADLRSQIDDNTQARQQAFGASLEATEEFHQLRGQLKNVTERNRKLSEGISPESN